MIAEDGNWCDIRICMEPDRCNRFSGFHRPSMDQFVVDLDQDEIELGTEVVIFGRAEASQPTAEQLGQSAGTINYEIVTRIGGRAERVYLNR